MSQDNSKNNRFLVFVLLYAAWCISYIDRSAIGLSAAQMATDLSLSSKEIGLVLSVFYIGYALMQFPGGWLADRYGTKYVILVAIAVWSVFTVLTGVAGSVFSLVIIRFLFGVGEGMFPPASIKSVVENFKSDDRSKYTAWLLSSNYVGAIFAPIIIAPLILAVGWHHTFMIIGVLGLVFVVVYALAVKHEPVARPSEPEVNNKSGFLDSIKLVLAQPLVLRLTLVWFAISLVNKGLDAWMPIYLLTERGLDLKSVGLLLPLPYIAGFIASIIGGWVMVRFFAWKEKYLLISTIFITTVFLYLMYTAETITGVIAAQAALSFFKSFVTTVVISLPAKLVATQLVGRSIGFINSGGMLAGFVAPVVMGVLVDASGFNAAFMFLIIAAASALVVSLSINSHGFKLRASPV